MHAHNMGAEILDHADGVMTAKVSNTLTQEDLARMQAAAGAVMSAGGKWRVLVLTENFAGWERGAKWDDFSFQAQHDASIVKMAIVGDRKWQELAELFTAKGMRAFPIQYFEPAQQAAARAWLVAP
jgi:hypothetical protein